MATTSWQASSWQVSSLLALLWRASLWRALSWQVSPCRPRHGAPCHGGCHLGSVFVMPLSCWRHRGGPRCGAPCRTRECHARGPLQLKRWPNCGRIELWPHYGQCFLASLWPNQRRSWLKCGQIQNGHCFASLLHTRWYLFCGQIMAKTPIWPQRGLGSEFGR